MALYNRQLVAALSRMPLVDSTELALIVGEPTVHRHLTDLLAEDIMARVIRGTIHLPSSGRYYLTAKGISLACSCCLFGNLSGTFMTLWFQHLCSLASGQFIPRNY